MNPNPISHDTSWPVILFYKYIAITDPQNFAEKQRALCDSLGLKGRILIAEEGINGTLAGAADALRDAIATPRAPLQQHQHDPIVSRCRKVLGEEAYAAAIAAGRAMSGDDAVSIALRWLAE